MIENDNEFYLWKSDEDWASAAVFWNKDSKGYGTDLSNAEVFTKERAQRQYNDRSEFVPVAKECIDELVIHKVDCQYISCSTSGDTHYLAVRSGAWDGNDLFFLKEDGTLSTEVYEAKTYDQATVLNQISTMDFYFVSKKEALSVARPTVTRAKINRRKMTTPYGIIKPKPNTLGMRRGNKANCGGCGRFISEYTFNMQCYGGMETCPGCEE